jgi:rhamnosyl/mannosyltransferase
VFFTGRLVYYKGVDVLLKAFRSVKDCELFIAGTGTLENELKAYAAKHKMNDRVHFLGFLPDTDLKAAFRDCDIFILPSVENSEAFGIVQLEAMVYSKPVINTSLPTGVPYVSRGGESGITVKPNDVKALADAINRLAADKELRKRYGAEAYNRICRYFDDSVVLGRIYEALSMGGK